MKWFEKFKVGDKVKPKDPKWKCGDGKIIEINRMIYVYVQYSISVCVICNDRDCTVPVTKKWYRLEDIEHVVIKNQQLVFEFMSVE